MLKRQSTLPRGERLNHQRVIIAVSVFQSTLPRGERPSSMMHLAPLLCFNPRSHMGSDQCGCAVDCRILQVSIHAPTWGATRIWQWQTMTDQVSIHAPTWGATSQAATTPQTIQVSIHAPTWGATPVIFHGYFNPSVFQSTLPHGERQNPLEKSSIRSQFQSTLPHGERLGLPPDSDFPRSVSIHAPTWGATP